MTTKADVPVAQPVGKKKLVGDPEILALNKIGEALASLSEDQRDRVLGYIVSRYVNPTDKLPPGTPDPRD